VRWRCRVWRSKMRRSSKMRCRCRGWRLRPDGWMCRHHQMPRGRRRPGDLRRNNGTPRHWPRELAHRCRSLFNRRPKRLTRPDSSEMAPGLWVQPSAAGRMRPPLRGGLLAQSRYPAVLHALRSAALGLLAYRDGPLRFPVL
jgi:hypothetical protein